MTRNQDVDSILIVHVGDSPDGGGLADAGREFFVVGRLAMRDAPNFLPKRS